MFPETMRSAAEPAGSERDAFAPPSEGASSGEPASSSEPVSSRGLESMYSAGDVLLDKYRLLSPLAQGGSGVVWVAVNTVLGVEVAIKIITSSQHEPVAISRRRAESEARVCASLGHPAICRVLDFGFTHRRDPFLVSELLKGENLDQLLARETRLLPTRAVQLLLPILDALEAAHEHGVVHRDVKPGNIYLAHEGDGIQPKLLDFGIARSLNIPGNVTTTGVVCGTPFYMSPEQARGARDIDQRGDLWSFCVTLYEALAGELPFTGENYNEILWSILHSEPKPLERFGDIDVVLARIVQRGLSKQREQRWCSAQALAQELAAWLLRQGVDADIRGVSLRHRVPASAPARPVPPSGADDRLVENSEPSSALARARRKPLSVAHWASGSLALGVVLATATWGLLATSNADLPSELEPGRAGHVTRGTPTPLAAIVMEAPELAPRVHAARPEAEDTAATSTAAITDPPEVLVVPSAPPERAKPERPARSPRAGSPRAPELPRAPTAIAASTASGPAQGSAPGGTRTTPSQPNSSAALVASNARKSNALNFDFGL